MNQSEKVKAILEELETQKAIRGKSDKTRWEAFSFVKHRTWQYSTSQSCPIKDIHLYDTTGVEATNVFASGFMDSFTPPNQNWFSPTLKMKKYGASVMPDFGHEYTDYVRDSMMDEMEHSNFYEQNDLSNKDTIVGGYSCMLIQNNPDADDGKGRIFCTAMNPWQCYFDKDLNGDWNLFMYTYSLNGRQILEKFPDISRESELYDRARKAPKAPFSMVYVIMKRNRIMDNNGNYVEFSRIFRRNMRYAVLEICIDTSEIISESGSTYFPVVIHNINDSGDSQYGCGYVMGQIEEFSKLNRIAYEYGLVIAKINHGAFFVPQAMMESFSNDPESRVPMQADQLVAKRVDDPVDLTAVASLLALQQERVRNIMYNSLFSALSNTDKVYTATQVNALKNESYSKLAPLYGTIQSKKLDPTLQIIMMIMIENDRLEVDPKYIGADAETKMKFMFESAMAKTMQAYANSNAANITIEALASFINLGFSDSADNVDRDAVMRDIMFSGGAPASYFIDYDEMIANRNRRQETARQQLDLENRVKESEINRNNAGASNLNNSGGFNGGAE